MEADIKTRKGRYDIPTQEYRGKKYCKYKGERYYSRGTRRLHEVVWEDNHGELPEGFEIHHKDFNTENNEVGNLTVLKVKQHRKLHQRNLTEEQREQRRKNLDENARPEAIKWHKSKEGREWHSQHAKEQYENREYLEKVCQFCGKKYKTRHTGISKYCHPNCKQKARNRRIKKSV